MGLQEVRVEPAALRLQAQMSVDPELEAPEAQAELALVRLVPLEAQVRQRWAPPLVQVGLAARGRLLRDLEEARARTGLGLSGP